MNIVFALLILIAVLFGAQSGQMKAVSEAALSSAGLAVELSIGLIGVMALWLGLMRVAEEAGLVRLLARALRPIMTRLFPEVPPDHPAMSAMVLNVAANALGLGNAATPLGIKAMHELQSLNPDKDTATDAMALFLTINTSSVQLVPATVIALREAALRAGPAVVAAGAVAVESSPGEILLPTLLATAVSTGVGVTAAKLLARRGKAEVAHG